MGDWSDRQLRRVMLVGSVHQCAVDMVFGLQGVFLGAVVSGGSEHSGGVLFLETPFFLYRKRRVEDLFTSLKRMADANHGREEVARVVMEIRERLKMDLFFQLKYG